ncbi:MAG TPA: HD domain-containing protein [Syntrophorhabdaceae bacterium]|nr:HD domain-containing protein [Syntrophorhabdaceae bacterium]
MIKKVFVKDIIDEGRDINDYFIVRNKGIYSSRNNTKYMSLELKDRTGVIDAKVWENVEELSSLFDRNDIIKVRAKTRFYQNKPQLNVIDIQKLNEDIAISDIKEFFSEGERNTEDLKKAYFALIKEIDDPYLISLFELLNMEQDTIERFFFFPASISVHHMYIGGLLEHSLSVAYLGKKAVELMGGNKDIIIAGSLLHDIGKIEELEFRGGFRYSDRGRLLGHITLGVMMLERFIRKIEGFPSYLQDILSHIIISHHGLEEWGSPKKPMSLEALTVHYIDNLDAKVMGVKEHMQENMEDDRWTGYHKLYESRFYKIPER